MKTNIQRRSTGQKRAILSVLMGIKTHPSAEDLFRQVKRSVPALSLGTIYRNLRVLRDEGKVIELTCGKYTSRYDGDTKPHHHFYCSVCGKIIDVDVPLLEKLEDEVAVQTGGVVRSHRLAFYGECNVCRKNKKGGDRHGKIS